MKLKGNYSGEVAYDVGDVVLFTDNVVYHLQYPCPAGIPPTDTKYWSRADQVQGQVVKYILDALEIESGNNRQIAPNLSEDALILKSSTESSTKEFIITVDDDGELTATELEQESGE